MKGKTGIVAICLFAAAFAHGAETRKCKASAKECEQQIRELLSDKRHLGVKVEDFRWGVVVKYVIAGSPADLAGLQKGDRIFAVNGRECSKGGTRQFKALLNEASTKEGGKVYLTLIRVGRVYRLSALMSIMSKEEIDKVVSAHLKEAHPESRN